MFPITLASVGQVCKIAKITGKEETRRFLENLGFVPDTEVSLISSIGGNVIINVKDSRIAVNQDMAKHIMTL